MYLKIICTNFFLSFFIFNSISQTTKHTQPQKKEIKSIKAPKTIVDNTNNLTDSVSKIIVNYKVINDSLNSILKQQIKENNNSTQTLKDSLSEKNSEVQSLNESIKDQIKIKRFFYLSIGILLLIFFILAIISFKVFKMNRDKSEVLEYATKNIDELYNLLLKKGIINTPIKNIDEYKIKNKFDLIKDKMKYLVEKYFNEDVNNKIKNEEIQNLKDQLKEINILKNDLEKKITNSKEVGATDSQPLNKFTQINYLPKYENSYIKSQTLVSAGPRKESINSDTELGEDVAGTLSLPGQTFFWLLDGTSDSAALKADSQISNGDSYQESHIFSSRLLAQNFGNYIQKHIEYLFDNKVGLEQLLEQAKKEILSDWEKIINNNISIEKRISISNLITQGFKPLCSTTIIVGSLLVDGSLYVLRIGDSKLFPFTKGLNTTFKLLKDFKFVSDPADENDRIAFRLDYDKASDLFIIKSNEPRYAVETATDISTVFIFSDGIGRTIENYLASDNPGIIEEIKQRISRIPQKTYDDKSLILLERLNIGNE